MYLIELFFVKKLITESKFILIYTYLQVYITLIRNACLLVS